MKNVKKILVYLLVIITALTSTACGKKEPVVDKTDIKEAEGYLFQNGDSEYSIVISSEADDNEITASRELQYFIKESTGFSLPIKNDEGLTFNKESKFIVIGENRISNVQNLLPEQGKMKGQGYIIKTIDRSIFLLGATSLGTLYSVYDFLNYEINFDYYFTDVYHVDCMENIKLKEYDVCENPDIDIMTGPSVGTISYNNVNANRMRFIQQKEWLIPINGAENLSVHNVFHILPKSSFLQSHPKWYSDDGSQLCFSAHGDKTEQNAMFEEIVAVVKRGLKQSKNATVFSISQMDENTFCTCDACNELLKTYKQKSALLILLCNKLSDYFSEYFKTEEGKEYARDIKFVFLAYQAVLNPPVEKSGNTFVPVNEQVKCKDNVGVYIAPDGFYYSYGLTEEGTNKDIYENIKAWNVLTNFYTFWIYDVNFDIYFYPYDSMYSKVDFYKFMKSLNTYILNDQAQTQNKFGSTAWGNLKTYLSTKLRWDVDSDLTSLTKGFFNTCYLNASEEMYSVYMQQKVYFQEMKRAIHEKDEGFEYISEGSLGSIFGQINKSDLWDRTIVEGWYSQMKGALRKVEADLSKGKKYENAVKMIKAEIVSPLYIMISLYSEDYSSEVLKEYKAEFKKYCSEAEILFYKDSTANGNIEKLYSSLGIV